MLVAFVIKDGCSWHPSVNLTVEEVSACLSHFGLNFSLNLSDVFFYFTSDVVCVCVGGFSDSQHG